MEVIESGPAPRRPPRRGLRLAAAGVALVALLVAAAVVVTDRRVQERELAAVRGCAAAAGTTIAHARSRVSATITYVSPALRETAPERVRADMYRLIRESAASGETAVRGRRAECAAIRVRARHDDLTAARTAWLTYLDAVAGQLGDTARGQGLAAPRPDLEALRTRAERLTPAG